MRAATGCLVGTVACVCLLATGLGMVGGAVSDDGAGEDFEFDGAQVPPQYLLWVKKAGKMCPEVSAALIAAQIEAESNWNPKARSPANAYGMSQFIAPTWERYKQDGDGDGDADIWSPPDAIMTQAHYDCVLADEVGSVPGDKTRNMLAAYNAGVGAVRQYNGVPPYPETQQYVSRILGLIPKYSKSRSDELSGPFGTRAAQQAKRWLGTPYSWGGGNAHGPTYGIGHGSGIRGFDCSGLTLNAIYAASQGRVTLPHSSQIQVTMGRAVAPDDIQAGDLVGFALHGGDFDHIGIYIGHRQFVHAPRTGEVVKISSLDEPYYASKTQRIRRLG